MKWWKVFAVAAVLLGVAATANGDSNTYNYQTPGSGSVNFNVKNGAVVDAYGNAKVVESFPQMDANLQFQDLIVRDATTSFLAFGAADSCSPVDTHRIRLGMLLIDASPAATTFDTTSVIRLAVQIRTHLNGQVDSSSVFPLYQYGRTDLGAVTTTASQMDTSVVGHLVSAAPIPNRLATPQAGQAWSGEFVVEISAKRSGIYNNVAVNGHTFYYPNGIALPLSSLFGREVYSPWTSVRVRYMSSSVGAPANARVRIHLVGTPL